MIPPYQGTLQRQERKVPLSVPGEESYDPAHLESSEILLDVRDERMMTDHVQRLILRKKVVVVGDACVGKSSLIRMFEPDGRDLPNKNYIMTFGVDLFVKAVEIPDTNATVDLFVYDVAGQSLCNQREMATRHLDDVDYVICVFEVSSRKSLQGVSKWLQLVRTANRRMSTCSCVLVANKTDLREGGKDSRSQVDTEEGSCFAQEHGLEYFECSAMDGSGVDQIFNFFATDAWEHHSSLTKLKL